jgi:hypothetical protein
LHTSSPVQVSEHESWKEMIEIHENIITEYGKKVGTAEYYEE